MKRRSTNAQPPNSSSPSAQESAAGSRRRGIDRVIALLDALLQHHKPARIGDIARQIGAPRSTTYEVVSRLIEAEILATYGTEGHIYFGRAAHLFGRAYADANPLLRRVEECLERLAAETHATAQFCGLKGNKYVVIDSRDGGGLFRITTDVGVEVPIPWTASGRLLLDHMSPDEIRAFVPADDFRLPDGRLLPIEGFLADIARARAEGSCVTTGLADRFACCLAAPIRDDAGVARNTLCFVIPADTAKPRRKELVERLVAEAKLLEGH
jgi:DNA-binding IclR family transcriptional regulator